MFIDVEGLPVKVPKTYEGYPQDAKDWVTKRVSHLKARTPGLLHVTVIRLENAYDPHKRRLIWNWSTL